VGQKQRKREGAPHGSFYGTLFPFPAFLQIAQIGPPRFFPHQGKTEGAMFFWGAAKKNIQRLEVFCCSVRAALPGGNMLPLSKTIWVPQKSKKLVFAIWPAKKGMRPRPRISDVAGPRPGYREGKFEGSSRGKKGFTQTPSFSLAPI